MYIGYVNQYKYNLLDDKKDGRDGIQEVYKKDSRKTFLFNLEGQIFKIFTLTPTMVQPQGHIKLNRLQACP